MSSRCGSAEGDARRWSMSYAITTWHCSAIKGWNRATFLIIALSLPRSWSGNDLTLLRKWYIRLQKKKCYVALSSGATATLKGIETRRIGLANHPSAAPITSEIRDFWKGSCGQSTCASGALLLTQRLILIGLPTTIHWQDQTCDV